MTVAPGFFGKLRSHGDFVSRRLPQAMLQPFDAWLQAGLVRSRIDLGDAWLPIWLSSPLWRFVLAPGVCGPQAWAGVMMPSTDRVGRCFPLTLAACLDSAPPLRDCLSIHAQWFVQMEDLALSTLDEGFALDAFDARLQALAGMPPAAQPDAAPPAFRQVCALSAEILPPLASVGLAGSTAWWTDGSTLVAPCLMVAPGLPPAADFSALLDGRWQS